MNRMGKVQFWIIKLAGKRVLKTNICLWFWRQSDSYKNVFSANYKQTRNKKNTIGMANSDRVPLNLGNTKLAYSGEE